MITDIIKIIGIDDEGRLYVTPLSQSLPMIYREAVDVHWNKEKKHLYSPKPRKWNYVQWYEQIISAAKLQGVSLVLSEETEWKNIPEELMNEIMGLLSSNESR